MASITKRNGKWQARISFKDPYGKYRTKSKAGFPTKKEAEYWASKNEVRKYSVDDLRTSDITFVQYFKEWYRIYKEPNIRDSSARIYQGTINIIEKYFTNTKLIDITHSTYQQFINYLGTQLRQQTIKQINTRIRASIKQALYDQLITRDFTHNISVSSSINSKDKLNYLNHDEASRLVDYAKKHLSIEYPVYIIILIAIYTGFRYAEIVGLTWDCIDFNNQTIKINKTLNPTLDPHRFTETKNPQSKRTIAINQKLIDALKEWQRIQTDYYTENNLTNNMNLVCVNDQLKTIFDNSCNQTLKRILKKLNCKNVSLHGLRHTHASFLLAQGISIYYISQRLGHKNYTTTLNIYSHIIKELEISEKNKAITALDNL